MLKYKVTGQVTIGRPNEESWNPCSINKNSVAETISGIFHNVHRPSGDSHNEYMWYSLKLVLK